MILVLSEFKLEQVSGIYTVAGQPHRMPDRARFLHPDAAMSYKRIPIDMRVSDMLRSATSSLAAVASGRGAQMPGRSGHNYGLSIDVDLTYVMQANRLTKMQLDELMKQYGWYCHRKDNSLESEAWHYNYFGNDIAGCLGACKGSTKTSLGIEYRIVAQYGEQMKLTPKGIQTALKQLKLYDGVIDGALGPQSRAAIAAFQRTVMLAQGLPTAETQRRLAFVTASRNIVPLAA